MPTSRDTSPPGLLQLTHSSRARGHGTGRIRTVEQTGWRRARHLRDNGESAPREYDGEDACQLVSRAHKNGGAPRAHPGNEGITLKRIVRSDLIRERSELSLL